MLSVGEKVGVQTYGCLLAVRAELMSFVIMHRASTGDIKRYSHQPFVLLLVEVLGPLTCKLQVVVWLVGLVVQVQTRHCFLGYSLLYLRSFVPLIKGSNSDNFWSDRQSCLQGCLIVTSIHAVSGVMVVPRSNSGVYIPWTHTGNKQQIVCIAKRLDGFPVLVWWAKREAIGGKVGVHAIKTAS